MDKESSLAEWNCMKLRILFSKKDYFVIRSSSAATYRLPPTS